MDQDRQVRLLISPFFILASLLWGDHFGGGHLAASLFNSETSKELLLGAFAAAILPIGFLISTFSVALLGLIAKCFRRPTYEAVLDKATQRLIWTNLRTSLEIDFNLVLYATATYDHELLSPGVHTWTVRRWNYFNIAVNSIVALGVAHALGFVFCVRQTWRWGGTSIACAGLLAWVGYKAWDQTMKMLEFQSHRRQSKGEKSVFTHMRHVKTETHRARNSRFEILVYQVIETKEYRIFIAKNGFGVGDVFTASQDVVLDAAKMSSADMVEQLIATAKDDIDRNEFGQY